MSCVRAIDLNQDVVQVRTDQCSQGVFNCGDLASPTEIGSRFVEITWETSAGMARFLQIMRDKFESMVLRGLA